MPFQDATLQDSLARQLAAPDSAALSDSTLLAESAAADSLDTIGAIGRDVGNTVSMLLSGDVEGALSRVEGVWQFLLIRFIPDFVSATLVLVLMYLVYRLIRKATERGLRGSTSVDKGLESLVLKTMTVVAWTFIIIMVLAQFGVNVTALLAGLSIAGIALGFAAKDSLENFISGMTILIDRPFRVGDQVDVNGTYGTVQEITLRSTRLRTLNNEVMVMPNMLMINQKLVNHSIRGLLRIEVMFGIAYKEAPDEARRVVLATIEGDKRILEDPPPSVAVTQLNNSSVDMALRFYVHETANEVPIRFEYTEKVFYALREAGIEIPFPHLQLFIDGAKALKDMPWGPR
ncbi:MAG: mechanosensitive ion channel family protein [Rhodothermales bacterium]